MNLRQSFNLACALQLDRVKAFGYDRAVSFTPRLGTAPLIQRTSAPESLGKERTAPSSNYHPQLHRSNRTGRYETAEAKRLKQESNERYRARRKELRQARARLIQQAFALEGES